MEGRLDQSATSPRKGSAGGGVVLALGLNTKVVLGQGSGRWKCLVEHRTLSQLEGRRASHPVRCAQTDTKKKKDRACFVEMFIARAGT